MKRLLLWVGWGIVAVGACVLLGGIYALVTEPWDGTSTLLACVLAWMATRGISLIGTLTDKSRW